MRVPRSRFPVVLLAMLVAACASMARLEPPTVEGAEVRLDRIDGASAYFGITVELANPNAAPLTLDTLDVGLAIEDEVVARVELAAPLTLPPNGRASAELAAQTRMDAILRAVGAGMLRGYGGPSGQAPTLRYAIQGVGTLRGGQRLMFARRGELRLPTPRSPS
jgi:LEA14-like dessication related protein